MLTHRSSTAAKSFSDTFRALQRAAQDAKSHASAVACMVLQGRATESDKAAAFAASDAAFAALDAQRKVEMAA